MKTLKDLTAELIIWLDSECPAVAPPLEPYDNSDLSHNFCELLRIRLDEIFRVKQSELSRLKDEGEPESNELYPCPYSIAVRCTMVDPCLGCETWAKYKAGEEISRLKSEGEDKLTCTDKCRWFNIGYGHCNFCIRQVKEHDCRDNFEPAEQSDKLTAEEIFNKIFNIPTGELPIGDKFIKFKTQIIKAMEAYHSQFVGEKVTDETQYEKSLRLIDEYFAETPKEEIQKHIDKYDSRPKWRRILDKLI